MVDVICARREQVKMICSEGWEYVKGRVFCINGCSQGQPQFRSHDVHCMGSCPCVGIVSGVKALAHSEPHDGNIADGTDMRFRGDAW